MGLVEGWIRLWVELVSARSARVGCAAVPVQWPVQRPVLVLVLVLLGGPGSVQPWVLALAPVLLRLVLARLVVE